MSGLGNKGVRLPCVPFVDFGRAAGSFTPGSGERQPVGILPTKLNLYKSGIFTGQPGRSPYGFPGMIHIQKNCDFTI